MNSADPLNLIDVIPPAAEGEDQGVGNESDFEIIKTREYIGPESKPVIDDSKEKNPKKDTTNNPAVKIGDPQPEEKKKNLVYCFIPREAIQHRPYHCNAVGTTTSKTMNRR